MRKKLYLLVILCILSVTQASSLFAAPLDGSYTLFTKSLGYTGAKYEPEVGTYLGAYVLQDKFIERSMAAFNEVTGKQHASFFKYVGYGKPFPKVWVEQVKSVGAVPHIAFEPNNGLEEVTDSDYLRQFARDAKEAGVPIFLRYASEMNGTWTEYSGKSNLYKEKWKLVHSVMKAEAPNVMMVWTVFTFPEETITAFYPGDAYVDWVGVNIYNVIYHNNNLNSKCMDEDPLKLLDYVYNTYSYKKPIQISEFGVSHYTNTDDKYYVQFAEEKIKRLYASLPSRYPRVKSIFYFDVNNVTDGAPGRQINDYSVTDDENVLKTYKTVVASPHYLSQVPLEWAPKTWDELLSFNSNYKFLNNMLYVNVDFVKNYMGIQTKVKGNNQITFIKGDKTITVSSQRFAIPKGFYNHSRSITGVPLKKICNALGYTVSIDGKKGHIYVMPKK
ncbi:MAG: copper amine oxidase protein [Clostridia bacterium]|jgi:hypothetical protein|nr:copper amine oxidase protein [Clostridia bacterium]